MGTVTYYTSDDASAPSLTDAQGSLGSLLSTLLVGSGTAYGSKTASGWTNPYNGSTGQYVFKQGGGNGMYLQVDDSAATAASTWARVVGFQTMTAYNTGTGQFPTNIQQSGGLYWPRFPYSSYTAGKPSRWACIATNKTFYFWNEGDGTNTGASGAHHYQTVVFFGDMNTYGANDTGCTLILGMTSANPPSLQITAVTATTSSAIIYAATTWLGSAGGSMSQLQGWHTDYWMNGANANVGNGGIAYPNPEDSGLYVKPFWLTENPAAQGGNNNIRGLVQGIWNCCHAASNFTQTAVNTANFGGNSGDQVGSSRSFTVLLLGNGSSTYGSIVFETSNTWY